MPAYTAKDVGCFVDSARGIYMLDAIIAFVRCHGADIEHPKDCIEHVPLIYISELTGCPCSNDYEDKADAYMNKKFPVEGCFWGRNENGDWGLWTIKNERGFIVTDGDRVLCRECYEEGLDEQDQATHSISCIERGVCDCCGIEVK